MAKFGEQTTGYDPFADISNSLSALTEPAPPLPTPEVKPKAKDTPRVRQQAVVEKSGGEEPVKKIELATPKVVSPEVVLRVTKRFKTTKEEAARLDQAAFKLSATLGISVDMSKITRALWEVYLRHEEEILRSMPENMPSKRPANYDAVGLAELDEKLAELVGEGLMMACMRSNRRM